MSEAIKTCTEVSEIAGQVIELRNVGASMSEVMGDGESELTNMFAMDAFETTRYRTEKAMKRQKEDFINKHFNKCLKTLTKK